MTQLEEAMSIAMIVSMETGELIEIGDGSKEFYPKLLRAITQMHLELQEYRKRPSPYSDLFSEKDGAEISRGRFLSKKIDTPTEG
jgi:hypothetical protein